MTQIDNRIERPDLMAKQIEKLYSFASDLEIEEGSNWYPMAHSICNEIAHKFNCPLVKVVGVVAALSPATNWQQNIADTHNLILAWHHLIDPNEVVVTTYGNNKRKAIRVLNLNSVDVCDIERVLLHKSKVNKTASFFRNILEPENDTFVTVDRHAIRIALGNSSEADKIGMTEKRYRNIVKSYQVAAKGLHLDAISLQAVVWVVYRRKAHLAASTYENEIYTSITNQIKA